MDNPIIENEALPVNAESAKPSGIPHGFDTGYAIAYGVEEAIMIRNFQHFITANANRGQNFRDGRFWTYDKLEDFPNHFPYWTVKQVRRILASLIEQGIIIKGEFNERWSNRTAWYAFKDQEHFIRNTKTPKIPLPSNPTETPDLPKWANENCPNGQMSDAQMGNCYNDTTSIATAITSSSSLKVPTGTEAAKAADVDGAKPSSKSKREKPDFTPRVRDVANQMMNILQKYNPVYRPPSDLTKFLNAVSSMVETDKQEIPLILRAFEWAVADNEERGDFKGWQGIICTNNKGGRVTNPAEIFKKHFSKIHSQMNSRPKRKFAASSDQNAAMEAMEEMNKRAL
jgi:hypothetical protein